MHDDLIKKLRNCGGGPGGIKIANEAADTIEAQQREIEGLKTSEQALRNAANGYKNELVAAVEDITQMANCKLLGDCTFCKHRLSVPDMRYKPCKGCERPNRSKSNFEWRGKERSNGR